MDVLGSTCIAEGEKRHEVIRRSANYPPSAWGDYFILSNLPTKKPNLGVETRIMMLKNEMKSILRDAASKPLEDQISLIDALQRLGVAYHFENEIEETLLSIHNNTHASSYVVDDDLYTVALCFRLLRQQRYNVSSGGGKTLISDQSYLLPRID